jgi:hypothetical protein
MVKVETKEFLLEVNGPEVHSSTVDSAKMLEFGAAYVDLLCKMAEEEENPISFTGLSVIDKCAAIQISAQDNAYARQLSSTAAAYIRGRCPPRGLGQPIVRVQESLRAFPREYNFKVINGPWEQPLAVPEVASGPEIPFAIENMRATVLRVGGVEPKVRLKPVLELFTFSASVERDLAKRLGEHLYADIDLVAKVLRTDEGRVTSCTVIAFRVVESEQDPVEAMRRWYKPYAEYWDKIDDVEGMLRGRDRSH